MQFKVLNDDGTQSIHKLSTILSDDENKNIEFISSTKKEANALKICKNYFNSSQTILFDETNKIIAQKLQNINQDEFKEYDFSMMFFTSGSTGNPVGALKTKLNLEEEVKVFAKLVEKYNIKQVIVTVPFIHIYGTLIGLLYPILNGIDIVLKEHFLPHNLLDIIDENSLIVTTPLYIKALNKISDTKDLSKSLFISSTAPLDAKSANEFITKFSTNIMQLFGSTETSGIAYKYNDNELWTPLESVKISTNKENELKISSPFLSKVLYENNFKNIGNSFQTFDYIEQYDEKFKLVGRSSKILKIAGKRYSTIQIEDILEELDSIDKALVFVDNSKGSLKDEILDITIQTKEEWQSLEIKRILKDKLSNLKFSIILHCVEKIHTNQVGKKLKITN
jgi:acyl-coenzyme A synthetase/AMP-(fatty) acid ligase